jgi:hypothetical protein
MAADRLDNVLPLVVQRRTTLDSLAIFTLTQINMYTTSPYRTAMLCGLVLFIWTTKLVKTIPWFWKYPMDFFLYFVIPAYLAFVYYHICLKACTAITFWDLTWSDRKLSSPSAMAAIAITSTTASVKLLLAYPLGSSGYLEYRLIPLPSASFLMFSLSLFPEAILVRHAKPQA